MDSSFLLLMFPLLYREKNLVKRKTSLIKVNSLVVNAWVHSSFEQSLSWQCKIYRWHSVDCRHGKTTKIPVEVSDEKQEKIKHQLQEDRMRGYREKGEPKLQIGDTKIKKVQKFKHLGNVLTEDGKFNTEIRRRIGITKDAFQKINRVLRKRKTVRYKGKYTELLRDISPPVWQWILENLLKAEEETWSNRNVILQKYAEDNMDQMYQ